MSPTFSAPEMVFALFHSPIGWIGLVTGERGLLAIVSHPSPDLVRRRIAEEYPTAEQGENEIIALARLQLQEYFRGTRRNFTLPLDLSKIPSFTATVLSLLARIPYGATITYGRLAALAGNPHAARAVGRAMAVNPLPIILPCHRVVGAGGRMVGYSGGEGITTKEWLLELEQREGESGSVRQATGLAQRLVEDDSGGS